MKKKFISLLSIMLFIFSIPLSAFASSNFNLRVFHGTDNISVLPPANNGDITIFVDSMTREQNGGIITDKGYVHFLPMIVVAQNYDLYFIAIDFLSLSESNISEVFFKVGDNLHEISLFNYSNKFDEELQGYDQTVMLVIDRNTINFIEDLSTHRNEPIDVYLVDSNQIITFTMTDDVKNGTLLLYDLYKQAGGTSKNNLDMVWLYNSHAPTYHVEPVNK